MLETRFIDVHGIRTRYAEMGSGPCLTLLHGFPETLQGWRKNVPELSRRFRVIAPDMVGFGQTDRAEWDYSCRGMARFVHLFLEALGVSKTHLVGTDTGASIALAFAAEYPKTLDRLTVLSGSPYPHSISAPEVNLMTLPVIGDLGFFLFGGLLLPLSVRLAFRDPLKLEKESLTEYASHLKTARSKTLALRLMREANNGMDGVMKKLRASPPPTLILWSEHERYFRPWVPDRLHKDLAGSRLERVADAGHFFQEERPDEFNRLVSDFL